MMTPIGNCLYFAKDHNKSVSAAVAIAGRARYPSTVVWLIISIIILTVYDVACRWISHISVEILKFLPLIAELDPTTTVILVFLTVWIFTSGFNTLPNFVDTGVIHVMCPLTAATTTRQSATKCAATDNFFCTALTSAQPLSFPFSFSIWPPAQYQPTAKSMASQIDEYFCFSH